MTPDPTDASLNAGLDAGSAESAEPWPTLVLCPAGLHDVREGEDCNACGLSGVHEAPISTPG